MNQPVLSIDVAKGKSVAAAYLSREQLYRKPFTFEHTLTGIQHVLTMLSEMTAISNEKPHIVLEATGNYSKPISSYFAAQGFPVSILNPILTHQLKKKSIRKVKTDAIDASRIAQTFYLGNHKASPPIDDALIELRSLTRQYHQFNSLCTDVQQHFQAVLDLVFPGYDRLFSQTCSGTSLRILAAYPTPKAVLAADPEHLLSLMTPNRRGRAWNERKLQDLLATAQQSLPDVQGQSAHCIALRCYIELLIAYRKVIDEVEAQMVQLARRFPAFELLRSIPGVGQITGAVILAEIGEIKRFPSSKQLSAFAGLDASVFESGTYASNRNRISKRGSAYLRTALYQATVAAIAVRSKGAQNPILSRYYQQKLAEGKPKKVALIATCHKLLRMVYGIWSSGQHFSNR